MPLLCACSNEDLQREAGDDCVDDVASQRRVGLLQGYEISPSRKAKYKRRQKLSGWLVLAEDCPVQICF